jgi:predicted phage gp36 major capsid-like protein
LTITYRYLLPERHSKLKRVRSDFQDHWEKNRSERNYSECESDTVKAKKKGVVEQDTMDWNSQRGQRSRRKLGGRTTEKEPLKVGQTWNEVNNWLRIGSNGTTL